MKRLLAWAAALALAAGAGAALAVESDPLPVPKAGPAASATRLYNDGVALLVKRNFKEAQAKFEAALTLDDKLAEAHNNLAYALRMQGPQNFDKSLAHYNRAIFLKPTLAQAYMYRGVLFVQKGDTARAQQDLERLRQMDPKLAADLERVMKGDGPGGADRSSGVAGQYE
jgi:tetratricopeptide (TPR) repeat protein